MPDVAIVYFSGTGHTHLMAEAVARGVESVEGAEATLLRIVGAQIVEGRWKDEQMLAQIAAADAIIFGTPTYMGGPAAQFKAFIDAASGIWFQQGWKDKLAAGFTHSSSPSGDKQGTLLYLATNAAQHGMLWLGTGILPTPVPAQEAIINRVGSFLGAMGFVAPDMSGKPAEIDPGDRLTAEHLGARVAQAATRWTGKG